MRKLFLIIALLIPLSIYAAQGRLPLTHQTSQTVSGVDEIGEMQLIRVVDGALVTTGGAASLAHPPVSVLVDIPDAGATDRTQAPENDALSCTIQAVSSNVGSVYVGGDDVTNSSGANRGFELTQGSALSSISVSNMNLLYLAADNAGDDAVFFCN
jgi:hypothetical protein